MKYDDETDAHKNFDMITNHPHLFESYSIENAPISYNNNAKSRYNNYLKSDYTTNSNGNNSDPNQTNHELTVVGYSSNLYRDDFAAMKLDKQLIPWNGDENLLIDRYDCRGYLYDLSEYDADLIAKRKDTNGARFSSEEIEIEKMCDEERYMFLNEILNENSNLEEDENGHDQTNKPYGAVKHAYDENNKTNLNNTSNNQDKNNTESMDEDSSSNDKTFVPTENLKLPIGMLTPQTVKMNQIIVKTASFVVKQGLQMEILLKAKQSFNTQFDFLSYDNYLNPYYKHLQELIKTNQIDPIEFLTEPSENVNEQNKDTKDSDTEESDDENDDDGYLHPLLNRIQNITPAKPQIVEENVENKLTTQPSELPEELEPTSSSTLEYRANPFNAFLYLCAAGLTRVKKRELPKDLEPPSASTLVEQFPSSKPHESTPQFSLDDLEKVEHPIGEIKIMIDKLAEYVARNGVEFEENIRKKNDERFNFLQTDHKFYKYYKITIIKLKRDRVLNEKKSSNKNNSNSREKDHPLSPKTKNQDEVGANVDEPLKEKEIELKETKTNSNDESENEADMERTTKSIVKISNTDCSKENRRSRSRSKCSRDESKRRRRSSDKEHKRKKQSKRRHSEKRHRHHKKDEKHRSRKKSEKRTSSSRSRSSSSNRSSISVRSSSRNSSDVSSDSEIEEKRKRTKKSSSSRRHKHKDSERHRDHKKKHKKKRSKDRHKK